MLYLLIAVLGACVLALIFLAVRKRVQKKQAKAMRREALREAQQPIFDWLERVDRVGCSNRELAAIPDAPDASEWRHLAREVAYRMERVTEARVGAAKAARREQKARQTLVGLLAQMNDSGRPLVERFKAALAIKFHDEGIGHYLNEGEAEDLYHYLQDNLQSHVNALLEASRNGDRVSFIELAKFTDEGMYREGYRRIANADFENPEDWDDLVVRFHENPSIENFRLVNRDQHPGAVRHMAARALKQCSLKEAQIALAFCSVKGWYGSSKPYYPWRDEIGDVLLAELTKMVHRLQAEQDCVFTSAQEV